MSRDEVKRLFSLVMSVYPTFHSRDTDEQLSLAIDGWWMALSDLDFTSAQSGLSAHIKSCKWPPSPHEIRDLGEDKPLDMMHVMAIEDEVYRRHNPNWHHGTQTAAKRGKWLEENGHMDEVRQIISGYPGGQKFLEMKNSDNIKMIIPCGRTK